MKDVILASDLTTCNRVVSSGLLVNLSVASFTPSRSKETFAGSGEKGTVIFDAEINGYIRGLCTALYFWVILRL
jgi:hypothetical protein